MAIKNITFEILLGFELGFEMLAKDFLYVDFRFQNVDQGF